MAHRWDNDVEFLGSVPGGGQGNLIIGNAASSNRRTPADVMVPNDTMIIKIEETGRHETTLCTLISSTEMQRTRVLDRWDRTGALTTPIQTLNLQKVDFSAGTLYCAGTLPQPANIVLQPDGTFAYADEVRRTVIFPLIANIQAPISAISNGQVVFAVSGLATGDNLGGLFLYNSAGDAGTINNIDIFAAGTVGSPRAGILVRQRMDIAAAFFRTDLSVYTPIGGSVVRRKVHSLARGVSGAEDAWMGEAVRRGSDAIGAYTEMEVVARDRQTSEVPFARARSYGTADDRYEVLKPLGLPRVAQKSGVRAGTAARVDADERLYYNDVDRGIGEIPLSQGAYRAIVASIADLRLLTPEGFQDGEVVLVTGSAARGDGDMFEVSWSSGSSTADNGVDVFKPDVQTGGAPWTGAGRFLAIAPIRAIKFANGAATPSVAGGAIFTAADTPPAGGITNFTNFRNNKRIKLQPGSADCILVQSNGVLELPERVNFTLRSVANGGTPIFLERENGVISMVGGAGVTLPWVSVVDYGAVGGNASSDTAAFQNAIASGARVVYVPYDSSAYRINAQLTLSANQKLLSLEGATIQKAFNGDLLNMNANNCGIEGLIVTGDGANYTGRGAVIASGSDQFIKDSKIYGMAGYCLEFTANDAGLRFRASNSVFRRDTSVANYDTTAFAVKLPGTDSNGNRYFDNCYTEGGAFIDISGAANTRVLGGNFTTFSMGSTASRSIIVGNRIASLGNTITIDGSDNVFEGNVCAGNIATTSGSQRNFIGQNVYLDGGTVTDAATAVPNDMNRVYDLVATITPTWGADGTSPSLGNGTLTGWVAKSGRVVYVQISLGIGSTTTVGTNDWWFQLPSPYSNWTPAAVFIGNFRILDSGTGFYGGVARFSSADNKIRPYTSDFAANGVRAGTPITWANGDSLELSLVYFCN